MALIPPPTDFSHAHLLIQIWCFTGSGPASRPAGRLRLPTYLFVYWNVFKEHSNVTFMTSDSSGFIQFPVTAPEHRLPRIPSSLASTIVFGSEGVITFILCGQQCSACNNPVYVQETLFFTVFQVTSNLHPAAVNCIFNLFNLCSQTRVNNVTVNEQTPDFNSPSQQ